VPDATLAQLPKLSEPAPDEIQAPKLTDYPGYPGRTLSTRYVCRQARYLVASVFDIDPLLLRNPTRGTRKIALAMQLCVHLAHIVAGRRHDDVAKTFERNRSTASHNFEVMENLRDVPEFDLFLTVPEARFSATLTYAESKPTEQWGEALKAMMRAVARGELEADAHFDAKYVVDTFLPRARPERKR